MKAKNLFFGALTCLAFAACSNDDDTVVNPGGAQAEGDGGKYISVNIVTPALTRATDMNYADGEGVETQVNDVQLVFLSGSKILTVKTANLKDNQGTGSEKNETAEDDWNGSNENGNDPQVEKVTNTLSVYLVPSETEGNPTGIIAILNGQKYGLDASKIKGLGTSSALLAEVADYGLKDDNFLMTNSVWKANSDGITEIKSTDFYTDADKKAAEGNDELTAQLPVVDIYVERVLAKVQVNNATTIEYKDYYDGYAVFDENLTLKTTTTTDGKTVSKLFIKPYILGYHLAATTESSYLIKNIDTGWNNESWWNDAANFRSYWANTPEDVEYKYNIFSTWKDNQASTTPVIFYCQENTSDTKTKLVVLAEHKLVNSADEVPTASSTDLGSLVYCNGGYYIDTVAYKNFLARELSNTYTASNASFDWAENLDVKHGISDDNLSNQWVIYAELNEVDGVTFTEAGTTTSKTVTDINTSLQNDFKAMYWQAGKAYYHTVILHDGESPMNEGVVRNHVYSLTVQSIKGLGSPVYDPNDDDPEDDTPDDPTDPDPEIPIVPDTPSYEETYVQARINVLKWRVVANQDVNLAQ